MKTSENIGKLAGALALAQAAIGGAKKDSANPFFNSVYADLESVWSACREALTKNGLSVAQGVETTFERVEAKSDKGGTYTVNQANVIVTTRLLHSSGDWLESSLTLVPVKSDPQGLGSAITYGRRYALAAIVGVYQIDDDGNAASRPTEPSPAQQRALAKTQAKESEAKPPVDAPEAEAHPRYIELQKKMAGAKTAEELRMIAGEARSAPDLVRTALHKVYRERMKAFEAKNVDPAVITKDELKTVRDPGEEG